MKIIAHTEKKVKLGEDEEMDNFKAVYKILSTLEKAMDYPEFDSGLISSEKLSVSEERWKRYIEMMADVGYVKGVQVKRYVTGDTIVDVSDMRITLKGLEYLQENTIMRKIYNAAKGVKDITPGL